MNMFYEMADKDAEVRINDYCCDLDDTIEYLYGISNIEGLISDKNLYPHAQSLSILFDKLNIQMDFLS
jgi:hypothetical protein